MAASSTFRKKAKSPDGASRPTIASLKQELEDARARIRQLEVQLTLSEAAVEKATEKVRRRFVEIASITEILMKAEIKAETAAREAETLRSDLEAEREKNPMVVAAAVEKATDRVSDEFRQQLADREREAQRRTEEIAQLTRMLEKAEDHAKSLVSDQHSQTPGWVASLISAALDMSAYQASDQQELRQLSQRLVEYGVIDEKWYLNTYPDVAEHRIDPGIHFLVHGIYEGRAPRAE